MSVGTAVLSLPKIVAQLAYYVRLYFKVSLKAITYYKGSVKSYV